MVISLPWPQLHLLILLCLSCRDHPIAFALWNLPWETSPEQAFPPFGLLTCLVRKLVLNSWVLTGSVETCHMTAVYLVFSGNSHVNFLACLFFLAVSVMWNGLSHVHLLAMLRTIACQVPPSMGILQKRTVEWVAVPFSGGSSALRD